MAQTGSSEFPCSLDLDIPFPTRRLANVAHQALSVDKELSPLVTKKISLKNQPANDAHAEATLLHVQYRATTNRMLRVAVNSFMDSLNLVIEVMEQLDTDVLKAQSGGEDALSFPIPA